ncbi:MAG: hypothetical protein AAF518_18080 [Spirochaetota bacterium]
MNFLKSIDLKKFFLFLDDLARKVPENVASFLRMIAILVFILLLGFAAYYGWQKGTGQATQEGQDLAKDTRTLFQEEIEKDYNRRRTDIRMPSMDLPKQEIRQEMRFQPYSSTPQSSEKNESGVQKKEEQPELDANHAVNAGLLEKDQRFLNEKSRTLNSLRTGKKNPTLYEYSNDQLRIEPSDRLETNSDIRNPYSNPPKLEESQLLQDGSKTNEKSILKRGKVNYTDRIGEKANAKTEKGKNVPEKIRLRPKYQRSENVRKTELLPIGE